MSEIKKLTVNEYHDLFEVLGPFILVHKESPPEQYSKLYIPKSVQDSASKNVTTGRIVKKSINILDNLYDRYLHALLEIGDVVGYSAVAPIPAPVSSTVEFIDDSQTSVVKKDTVLIHYQDIISVFAVDKEAFQKRVQEVNAYFKPLFPSYHGDLPNG
jgi:hypothetical protein